MGTQKELYYQSTSQVPACRYFHAEMSGAQEAACREQRQLQEKIAPDLKEHGHDEAKLIYE